MTPRRASKKPSPCSAACRIAACTSSGAQMRSRRMFPAKLPAGEEEEETTPPAGFTEDPEGVTGFSGGVRVATGGKSMPNSRRLACVACSTALVPVREMVPRSPAAGAANVAKFIVRSKPSSLMGSTSPLMTSPGSCTASTSPSRRFGTAQRHSPVSRSRMIGARSPRRSRFAGGVGVLAGEPESRSRGLRGSSRSRGASRSRGIIAAFPEPVHVSDHASAW